MMVAEPAIVLSDEAEEQRDLHWQAQYYRALHARSVRREAPWREEALELRRVVRRQETRIKELSQELEETRARTAWLERQLFGEKSERSKGSAPEFQEESKEGCGRCEGESKERRPRGKQPGAKGYGRKRRRGLASVEIFHDLPQSQKRCPKCGKPFAVFPGTEDSEEIDWEVRLVRRIHKRARYRPTCDCHAVSGIVSAPVATKLIPKGMFSTGFWVRLLAEKYLFQRPLYRIRKALALEGLEVSQGTLTGGLKRIGELLQPLYGRILERSRAAEHWHMDETRWLVFEEVAGKVGHRWWLWVIVTGDTCAYLVDPSRSATVVRNFLGQEAQGIISADRYRVYGALGENIRVAYC